MKVKSPYGEEVGDGRSSLTSFTSSVSGEFL